MSVLESHRQSAGQSGAMAMPCPIEQVCRDAHAPAAAPPALPRKEPFPPHAVGESLAEPGTHLVEHIVGCFRTALEEHLLHPGDRLPPERDLARRLNVSRATLRQAIGCLAAIGVLRIRRGIGTFVTEGSAEIGKAAIGTLGILCAFQPWQMYEARRILERRLVMLAAERGQESDFAALAEEVAEMYATCDDPAEYPLHDLRFHRGIAHASGNAILAALMDAVASGSYAQQAPGNFAARRAAAGIHREIYRSIRSRDALRAGELMKQHLHQAEMTEPILSAAEASLAACAEKATPNQGEQP